MKPYLTPFLLTLSAVVVVLYAVGAFVNFDINPGHWTTGDRSAVVLLTGVCAVVLEVLLHRPLNEEDEEHQETN